MFSLTRLLKAGHLLAFSLVVFLLVSSNPSKAQHLGASGGFRSTPGLPVIAFPVFSGGASGIGGQVGGIGGLGAGGAAGGSVTGSFSTSIKTFDLGSLFPNHGQIIGLPPPTMMPLLNNFGTIFIGPSFGPYYFNPLGFATPFGVPPFGLFDDSTGSPLALPLGLGILGGGLGAVGGGAGGLGGGAGGAGGGAGGAGGGVAGLGGGVGGFGNIGGGGGGFAGKGFGGFNGRKPL